jgi:IS30 family transposase
MWRAGMNVADIARAIDRVHVPVYMLLRATGGIEPPLRAARQLELCLEEREEISRGLSSKESLRSIARRLSRCPSTISREVKRNGGLRRYRACSAHERASDEACRPKRCKLAKRSLRRVVESKLALDWSPEQISNWLPRQFPDDNSMRVSHETIYRSLYVQARGLLKKELQRHLRTGRVMRQSKQRAKGGKRGTKSVILDAVSISERPPEVEDRAVPGHWEGDLIQGANFSFIATLVERSSRYTMLLKLPSKRTEVVVAAIQKQIVKLPDDLRHSLTWDRGMELANHKQLTLATNVDVYFCDPASPWQRGTNENTNGLLRQYFPNGTNLTTFSQADLNRVAHRLNTRPRKTLDFRTPAEFLNQALP